MRPKPTPTETNETLLTPREAIEYMRTLANTPKPPPSLDEWVHVALSLTWHEEKLICGTLGIQTLKQLVRISPRNILSMRGYGKGFVAALQAKLAAIGFTLANSDEGLPDNIMNDLFQAHRQKWDEEIAANNRMKQRLAEIWQTIE